MKKKALVVIAVMIVLSLILTACGGTSRQQNSEKNFRIRCFCVYTL